MVAVSGAGGTAAPIVLWAVPRSRSTAFLRAMIERGDLDVVHEPFSYLSEQGHFELHGERLESMPELLGALIERSTAERRVFVKDTSDYRYDPLLRDERLFSGVVNTFMIREPRAAVASHHAMNPQLTLDEVGFEYLHTIFTAVRDATGEPPLVVDGDDLVAHPEATMRAYCERVGLVYRPEALKWQPGAQPAWQRTGRWHRDVDQSSGLAARPSRHNVDLDEDPRLAGLVAHHQPFYEALYAHRLGDGSLTG